MASIGDTERTALKIRLNEAPVAASIAVLSEIDPDGAWSESDAPETLRERAHEILCWGVIDECVTYEMACAMAEGRS